MDRNVPLKRATRLRNRTPLTASRLPPVPGLPRPVRLGTGKTQVKNAAAERGALARGKRLRPRSPKTARKYVTRRAIVADLFAEPAVCEVPWCTATATDPHEPLTRARGGGILDRSNIRKVCDSHNLLFASAEEPWMYQLGFLKHSTLCCKDRDVCAQYSGWGGAA